MALTHAYVPYNPNFDFERYLEYRRQVGVYGKFIWTPDNMDHMRLPANISILDLLLYVGLVLEDWLPVVGYAGENILYSPAFPDIIYSSYRNVTLTADSPHPKVPPTIAYRVARREPASMAKTPFGSSSKQWKFRKCGDFAGPDGNLYRVRYRFWESEVEFVCIHRSGAEAEALCAGFEQFMDMNEGRFLEAGLNKMVPMGRKPEPIMMLEESGAHYRSTRFWFRTQEFQFAGPITPISDIHIDVAWRE